MTDKVTTGETIKDGHISQEAFGQVKRAGRLFGVLEKDEIQIASWSVVMKTTQGTVAIIWESVESCHAGNAKESKYVGL